MTPDLAGSAGYELMVACLNKAGAGADGRVPDYFVAHDDQTAFDAATHLPAQLLDPFEHLQYMDHVAAADSVTGAAAVADVIDLAPSASSLAASGERDSAETADVAYWLLSTQAKPHGLKSVLC